MTLVRKIVAVLMAAVVLIAAVFGIALVWYSHEQNKTIIVTEYTVSHAQIPAAFEGKRIVHLTDLHNKDFGDQLTQKVKAQDPDIIVITGDWISYHSTDITVAKRQAQAIVDIAPTYYVTGNHEINSTVYQELYTFLDQIGITILENKAVKWTQGEDSVQLIGVFDPEFATHLRRDFAPHVKADMYSIMLYHRPERFEEAAQYGADLLLSGHTHGGQIRLPFLGAIYAPDQRGIPKYDVGRFDYQDSTMIVSQGLGESAFMRILTPPEIVVVTLDSPHV